MNNLTLFSFHSQEIRVVGTAEAPWFVAQDICKVLGLDNVTKALTRLDIEDIDDLTLSDTIGRDQKYRIINESGLYTLVLGSRKEVAKPFKRWVNIDVDIRRH